MISNSAEHLAQIGFGVEAVQLRCLDQRVYCCGALAAAVGACEDPVLAPEGNRTVILPISGKRLRFITAGMRCMGGEFDANTSSGAPAARLFMSRWRPATS